MSDYTGIHNLEVMREALNYNRFLLDLIMSHATPRRGFVDFGAGVGTFALRLVQQGRSVTCIEPDATLSRNLSRQGLTVYSDLAQLPDASIDYIYSLNVLEHISDDAEIIKLWYRKLRYGGRLLVYVPAFQLLFSSMDRKVGHFRRYRLRELCKKLRGSGFDIHTARYVDSLGFLATLLFKYLDDGAGDINVRVLKLYDRAIFPVSRIIDVVGGKIAGKNVYALGVKPL